MWFKLCTTPVWFSTVYSATITLIEKIPKFVNFPGNNCWLPIKKKALCPIIVWKWSIHYTSFSAMFYQLQSSTNQELFEKYLCYQSSRYGKYGQFLLREEAVTYNHQIDCQQRWMGCVRGHMNTAVCQKCF